MGLSSCALEHLKPSAWLAVWQMWRLTQQKPALIPKLSQNPYVKQYFEAYVSSVKLIVFSSRKILNDWRANMHSDVNLLLVLLPLIISLPLSTWLCFSFCSVFLKQCLSPRSVSGKKLCSTCGLPLGKGAAMIIETLGLYFHIQCFRVCLLLCPQ